MPTSMFNLPLSEKRPLADHELLKINRELRKLDTHLTCKVLLGIAAVGIIAGLPSNLPGEGSLIGQFGLFKGLALALLLFFVPVFWLYRFKKAKLKKDLCEKAKIVRQTNVARKERSFLSKKIYARIDSNEPVCHEFEVDDKLFDSLEQGQHVKLEFTPNSMCLINVEYPLG